MKIQHNIVIPYPEGCQDQTELAIELCKGLEELVDACVGQPFEGAIRQQLGGMAAELRDGTSLKAVVEGLRRFIAMVRNDCQRLDFEAIKLNLNTAIRAVEEAITAIDRFDPKRQLVTERFTLAIEVTGQPSQITEIKNRLDAAMRGAVIEVIAQEAREHSWEVKYDTTGECYCVAPWEADKKSGETIEEQTGVNPT